MSGRRSPARRARGTADRTGRRRPARAPRRGARGRRRTAGCPPCRPAPRRSAGPSASAVSSTVWCASTSRSPSVRTVRSNPPCLPSWLEHVVEERHAGVDSRLDPVPSRSSSTRTFDSSVSRSIRANLLTTVRRPRRDRSPAPVSAAGSTSASAARNASSSSGSADGDAQPAGQADVADQDPAVEQALPGGRGCRRTRRTARSSRRSSGTAQPQSRSGSATSRSRSGVTVVDACASSVVGVPQRDRGPTACVSADRWYGSRTSRSASTTAGSRREVADPGAGHARTPCTSSGSRPAAAGRPAASSALAVPARANSAYASSTTTMPGAAA